MDYISQEPICNNTGYIVRHHPLGKGFGSEWDFICILEKLENGRWILKAAWGNFSKLIYKRIYKKLEELGITLIQWQRIKDLKKDNFTEVIIIKNHYHE